MKNPYKEIFGALTNADVEYLIVGGVAVNLYGYKRFTGDVDIMLSLEEKNLRKMEALMKSLGYIQRLPVELLDMNDVKKVKNWLKTKGMTAYTFISDKGMRLDIDILVGKSLDFKKFYKKCTKIEVWDMIVPVVSIDDLIEMKREAGRDKDLLDLKELLELKGL
ncbi:MAG: hypothetical protein AAB373_04560 [Patescibacteria group bacterium]